MDEITALKWEDASVDGVEDEKGDLIPCRVEDDWCPLIELATGKIRNWVPGTTADIHYKVCDDGSYALLDADQNVITKYDGYVPALLWPEGDGFGDYIIMKVDEDGMIANWKPTFKEFEDEANEAS